MPRPTVVKLEQPKPKPVPEVIKELKELLALAERAELRGLALASNTGDRDPTLCITGEWETADLVFAVTRLANLVNESDED